MSLLPARLLLFVTFTLILINIHNGLLIQLLIIRRLFLHTDACFKRTVTVTVRSGSTLPPPSLTDFNDTETTEASHHRKSCTADETFETDCQNDGQCFVIVLAGGVRQTQCR